MRKKIIVGNWKMNFTTKEALNFISVIKDKISCDGIDVAVCPSYVSINDVKKELEGYNIKIGAQNVHYKEKGTHTGEISIEMLQEIGVDYIIIGHSERRQEFNETDDIINKKAKVVLAANLIPIMCVGENKEEREENIHKEKIELQVKMALDGIDTEKLKNVVIAYEPIWAINTAPATKEIAEEMISHIRDVIFKTKGSEVSNKIRIQYGGSTNSSNTKEFLQMPNIDGLLVGGASLKEDFIEMINIALKTQKEN